MEMSKNLLITEIEPVSLVYAMTKWKRRRQGSTYDQGHSMINNGVFEIGLCSQTFNERLYRSFFKISNDIRCFQAFFGNYFLPQNKTWSLKLVLGPFYGNKTAVTRITTSNCAKAAIGSKYSSKFFHERSEVLLVKICRRQIF